MGEEDLSCHLKERDGVEEEGEDPLYRRHHPHHRGKDEVGEEVGDNW